MKYVAFQPKNSIMRVGEEIVGASRTVSAILDYKLVL